MDHLETGLRLFDIPISKRARNAHSTCLEERAFAKVKEGLKRIAELGSLPTGIKEREEIVKEIKKDYSTTVDECFNSLSFPQMRTRAATIERPVEDTCTWIYSNDFYRSWELLPNSLLWIKGKPGSGKLVLMKSLYQKRQQITTTSVFIAFFFDARGTAFEKTRLGLYRALMHDLLSQLPVLACEFLPTFLQKKEIAKAGGIEWHEEELAETFHQIIEQEQPYCTEIMIDALDECNDDQARLATRRFERTLSAARKTRAQLRVYWSSRVYPTISLHSEKPFELLLDDYNSSDIRQYVEQELSIAGDDSLRVVREDLITRAREIFLWAVLVCRRLGKAIDQGYDQAQLRELLSSLPTELEGLYERIFEDVGDQRLELVPIAQWIFYSFRPVKIDELFMALLIANACNFQPLSKIAYEMSSHASRRRKMRIVDVSGGLFEVVGGIVQVIHESVRQFFLGPKGLKVLKMSSLRDFILASHERLTLTCFKALLAIDFQEEPAKPLAGKSIPTADVLKSPGVHHQSPFDKFLQFYVCRFTFDHFAQSRSRFDDNLSDDPRVNSPHGRRQVLHNFLRYYSSLVILSKGVTRRGVIKHLRAVENDPAAFGLSHEELLKLIARINNLLACCTFLDRKGMELSPERGNSSLERCIGLFYLSPWPRTDSSVRFVFAMTFLLGSEDIDSRKQLDQFLERGRFLGRKTFRGLKLYDWRITGDADDLVETRAYKHILKDIAKTNFHELNGDVQLHCVILRCADQEDVISADGVELQIIEQKYLIAVERCPLQDGEWWFPAMSAPLTLDSGTESEGWDPVRLWAQCDSTSPLTIESKDT